MLLEIDRLDVHYDRIQVLWEVSLAIDRGEIVIIVGSNGAGKSTLLKAVAGVIPVSQGGVRFKGRELTGIPSHKIVREGLSLIPEGAQIFPSLSVRDNLEMGNYQERKPELKASTLAWIYELFPVLENKKKLPAGTLSGGQRQMLAVGIGLMSHPEVLLIDEPSSGLAPILVKQLMGTMEQIRLAGTTVVLVEQNFHAALSVADRGYVLENGRVVMTGDREALLADPHVKTAYLGR